MDPSVWRNSQQLRRFVAFRKPRNQHRLLGAGAAQHHVVALDHDRTIQVVAPGGDEDHAPARSRLHGPDSALQGRRIIPVIAWHRAVIGRRQGVRALRDAALYSDPRPVRVRDPIGSQHIGGSQLGRFPCPDFVSAGPGRRGEPGHKILTLMLAGQVEVGAQIPIRRTHGIRGLLDHEPIRLVIDLQQAEKRFVRSQDTLALAVGDDAGARDDRKVKVQDAAVSHPAVDAHFPGHHYSVEQKVEDSPQGIAHGHFGVGQMHAVRAGTKPGDPQVEFARAPSLVDGLPCDWHPFHLGLIVAMPTKRGCPIVVTVTEAPGSAPRDWAVANPAIGPKTISPKRNFFMLSLFREDTTKSVGFQCLQHATCRAVPAPSSPPASLQWISPRVAGGA